jgi:hypothetical protein
MSELSLERRCRRIVRAYPAGPRAEEVLTTLMDSNEGRRRPRVADAFDVLWHGLATRLGDRSAGTRFGRWGDAASVAVVAALVMQTTTAIALVYRLYNQTGAELPRYVDESGTVGGVVLILPSRALQLVATATVLLAVAATAAACLGRVRTARWLVAVTALAGLASVVTSRSSELDAAFTTPYGVLAAIVAAVCAAAVVFGGTVARAARAVPAWWWGLAAVPCMVTAGIAVDMGRGPFLSGRAGVALTTYGVQALVLFFLALPLVRQSAAVFAGAAATVLLTVPWLIVALSARGYPEPRMSLALGWTAFAWVAVGGMVALAMRIERTVASD